MNSVPARGFPAKSVDIIPSVFPLRSHSWTDGTGDVDALEAIQTTQHSVWQWLTLQARPLRWVPPCEHVLRSVGKQRL